ncbi:MAG: hypothetical protein ABI977_02110 [Acidobacteriota bacterium]
MKEKTKQPQVKPESLYVGVREAAQMLGVSENRMAMTVALPDGTLGCKAFPSLKRIQDTPGGKGQRGSQILFVREQVEALVAQRCQPPQVNVERSSRTLAWSDEDIRDLLAMGPAGARVLRTRL